MLLAAFAQSSVQASWGSSSWRRESILTVRPPPTLIARRNAINRDISWPRLRSVPYGGFRDIEEQAERLIDGFFGRKGSSNIWREPHNIGAGGESLHIFPANTVFQQCFIILIAQIVLQRRLNFR